MEPATYIVNLVTGEFSLPSTTNTPRDFGWRFFWKKLILIEIWQYQTAVFSLACEIWPNALGQKIYRIILYMYVGFHKNHIFVHTGGKKIFTCYKFRMDLCHVKLCFFLLHSKRHLLFGIFYQMKWNFNYCHYYR